MADQRGRIQTMFARQHRFANFGAVIERIEIRGFRCHEDTTIEIESPITAISGLNGTGKSTVLQLVANAYSASRGKNWKISDFFSINAIDTAPFTTHARVIFHFTGSVRPRPLTISRSILSSRWQGYRRRDSREVFFAGIACYTPLSEQPSFVNRSRSLSITASTPADQPAKDWIKEILRADYSDVENHTLNSAGRRVNSLTSFTRSGNRYAEPNMGFGEARTAYIVSSMESLPEKSLVILEEPETSLHPSAQYQFGRYLVDVAIRRKLQIFLSTHSEYLLNALPDASRVYLQRQNGLLMVLPGLSASQANSLMTEGARPALTIAVEDDVAVAVLNEIIREINPMMLTTVKVVIGGSNDVLKKAMVALRSCGLNVAAVVDGDTSEIPSDNIFKLPGTLPPEKEIFQSEAFEEHIRSVYACSLADFSTSLRDADHHDWFQRLADNVHLDRKALVAEGARVYVRSLTHAVKSSLCESLRSAIR